MGAIVGTSWSLFGMQGAVEAAANAGIALQERLDVLGCKSIAVPIKWKTKNPAVPEHKGGAWTRQDSMRYFMGFKTTPYCLGILLDDDMFVLDFDARPLYERLCKQFTELLKAPTERTKNGVHVFFRRSEEMDEAGLTDHPLRDPATGERMNIDFKTVTKSVHNGKATRSVIVVTPSDGKSWVEGRSLLTTALDTPTPRLTAWIKEHIVSKSPRRAALTKERTPANAGGKVKDSDPPVQFTIGGLATRVMEQDQLFVKPIDDADRQDAYAKLEKGQPESRVTPWASGTFSGFSFKAGGACPCCKRLRPHNNQYYTVIRPDGVRRLHNHNCATPLVVPYSVASTHKYQCRWRAAADIAFRKIDPAIARALSECSPALANKEALAAWFDSETAVFYAEYKGGWFAAVGIEAELGRG